MSPKYLLSTSERLRLGGVGEKCRGYYLKGTPPWKGPLPFGDKKKEKRKKKKEKDKDNNESVASQPEATID